MNRKKRIETAGRRQYRRVHLGSMAAVSFRRTLNFNVAATIFADPFWVLTGLFVDGNIAFNNNRGNPK